MCLPVQQAVLVFVKAAHLRQLSLEQGERRVSVAQ